MTRPSPKYVLDTQLFIDGFRDRAANEALQHFRRLFAPFEFLSVIVAQELRSGIRRPEDRKALEQHVLRVFERANRTITPSADAWRRSGDLFAEMARKEGLEITRVSKAFGNDVLLCDRQIDYVKVYGDTVIVAGRETVLWGGKMPNAGRTERLRITAIWMKQQDRWQQVARHANVVSEK